MTLSPISLQVIDKIEDLYAVRSAWDALSKESAERVPTMTCGWVAAWWKAFGGTDRLLILLVWRGGELAAALPLMQRSPGVLATLSNTWVDRTGILVRAGDVAALEFLVQALASGDFDWDRLDLEQRPADSRFAQQLPDLFRRHGLIVGVDEGLQSPYLPMTHSWERVAAGLSASLRRDLSRKRRRVEQIPAVNMLIYKDSSVIDPIMAVSAHTWQHENGTSMASTTSVREFYESLIRGAAEDGTLFSSVLMREGIPVAFEFNIRCGGTLHNFKLGYRLDHANWSPGLVLKEFTIRRFIEDFGPRGEAIEYDMMGTVEPYKLRWTKAIRAHQHLHVARGSLSNRSLFYWRYSLKPTLHERYPQLVAVGKRLLRTKG